MYIEGITAVEIIGILDRRLLAGSNLRADYNILKARDDYSKVCRQCDGGNGLVMLVAREKSVEHNEYLEGAMKAMTLQITKQEITTSNMKYIVPCGEIQYRVWLYQSQLGNEIA